ncbi:MAG TPA: tetratricopeptide repeat protein [Nevskiaceae bacterium]|nr:tetratricopeptide repeat protein [Nevskiaceae bacterium]
MALLILSILIQVALVVHIVRTGRNMTWVFIVLFFPLIGSLAYFIVEMLPELRHSRTGRKASLALVRTVNPDKDLNAAAERFSVAETAQNGMLLAEAMLAKARFAEARDLYVRFLHGLHAEDPRMLMGLARAQFGLGEYAATTESLDRLKAAHPEHRSPEGHLLYARALEEGGNTEGAIEEYEALCRYYAGPEPFCRLGLLLKGKGEAERAQPLFEKVLSEAKVSGRHYNTIHKEWVAVARREAGAG